jgi:prepilin-type N-terminal cleavage/methylation domain-containing protein/prepilin-type processing-associated H-X9-DG protein
MKILPPAGHSKSRCSGFTLVELLVVIGIISILVGLTAPYLMGSMARARTAKCAGNLRAIGVGLLAFAGDNDGNFPQAGAVIPYNNATDGSGPYGWTQQIEGYMGGKGLDVYKCPDSSRIIQQNATYSYFMGAHAAFVESHGVFGPVSLMKMRAPSQHILAGDIAYRMFTANDADKDDYTQDPAFNGNSGRIPIHGGGSNILFADGHIEYLHSFDKNTMSTRYDGPGFDYLTP